MKANSFLLFFLYLLFTVSCTENELEPSFSIETTEDIAIAPEAGVQTLISFTSSREWQASITADWLTISPMSGNAGAVSITATANSLNDNDYTRTATLTLTSGALKKNITLKQEPIIQLEKTAYSVAAAGEVLEIRFSTSIAQDELFIGVSKGADKWLTQQPDTRASSYILRLTALPNAESASRTAYLYFVQEIDGKQKILRTVTITQQGVSAGESTDYSEDKKVRVLQTASIGKGIPIVIVGDGFIDKEIADGTYDQVMDKAFENLFTEEPIQSLRNYFNVYAVTAVSANNTFGDGYSTAFSCELEGGNSTGISGDDDACMEYARCVKNIDLGETLVVVVLNTPAYAGTTYFGYSEVGSRDFVEFAIAYCPVIDDLESETFRQVLVHEAIGHGFGKLLDEYAYEEQGRIPVLEINNTRTLQNFGWAQNVDFTAEWDEVLWSAFLNDERYISDNLGVFEGACTYIKGAYRPSEESMMRSNILGFNAPSRKALYDRTMKTATGASKSTYEEFVEFDLRNGRRTRSTAVYAEPGKPFAHPRLVNKALIK
ncbi:BACON domain-containing protein [Bacteroides salyersiae]|uniref:BACON domain-containing protein n=1 Tax=Bacteroides salyersiae TaxID=291644 RepID=UPI001C8C2B38|nr:M64 family metallopeptidase [Bacteroides salyersiae]